MRKYLTLIIVLFASFVYYNITHEANKPSTSYWLWAGITAKYAPQNSELYVYQGLITSIGDNIVYNHFGLYPHPIKSKKLYLVYRLEGDLANEDKIVAIFQNTVSKWAVHSVATAGLQLDFDSPTSKLLIYSNFLKNVRDKLPKQYSLSITGLGDWSIYGNKRAMESISMVTDEIVFQLYQGRYPLKNIENYIQILKNYPFPFRIGLLSRYPNNNYLTILDNNANFNGVIYFIQK
jgi:Protein of unknown function (DUF3142)